MSDKAPALLPRGEQAGGGKRPRPKAGPKKGVKSVPWDEDPQILARLEPVSQMMLRRARLWQIGEALGYGITTARKDRERVKELWAREAAGAVDEHRQASLAQMRHLQQQAYAQYASTKDPQLLRFVRECERDIILLEGTEKPSEHRLTLTGDERPLKHLTDAELLALREAAIVTQPKSRNRRGTVEA